jgi:hypothetical protein
MSIYPVYNIFGSVYESCIFRKNLIIIIAVYEKQILFTESILNKSTIVGSLIVGRPFTFAEGTRLEYGPVTQPATAGCPPGLNNLQPCSFGFISWIYQPFSYIFLSQ